ncbi:(deoxy)nucleoside triphosphate pyrophosphohydrolase [Chondrinema litorale]|uniref:(deoxy)nucleoside triphosphate pyrophosphohydrolase n=1 Tax=Chondrinema litorale TaxID=2994555 RepID=UPI0025427F42|nr:(deoxy)nucleoside triphosphate pyrophosphohydrolase [Chondrinema litorale]UZR99848.1 (deoxy)nucleoside triphosphate pyrophosphohydrolase [Chondrinema litorale]
MKKIKVSAAIIFHDDKILCVQRGESKLDYISKKFEFPGGKIEKNELPEETVIREIYEELQMKILVEKPFFTVTHQYPDFHLTMYSFICSSETKLLTLSEHISFKWLSKNELTQLDWAAADIPIVNKLIK